MSSLVCHVLNSSLDTFWIIIFSETHNSTNAVHYILRRSGKCSFNVDTFWETLVHVVLLENYHIIFCRVKQYNRET